MNYVQFENFGSLAAGTGVVTLIQVEWEFVKPSYLRQINLNGRVQATISNTTLQAGYYLSWAIQKVLPSSLGVYDTLPATDILTGDKSEPISIAGFLSLDNELTKQFNLCKKLPPQKYRLTVSLRGNQTLDHYYYSTITMAYHE